MAQETAVPSTPPASASSKARVTAFDGFRGVSIVFVVIAHAAGYGWEFQAQPGGQVNFYFSLAMRNLALFSLPMFLFVSGYWLASVKIASRAEYNDFMRKRVARIAIPYLFWSVLLVAWQAFRSHSYSPQEMVMKIVLGQADGPYYFILLMIQFYILAPLFSQWARSGLGMLILIAAHVLCVAALYVMRAGFYPDLSYATVKLPFFSWLSLFPLGMYVRNRPDLPERFSFLVYGCAAVLLFIVQMAETEFWMARGWWEFAISDVRFSSLLFGVAMIFCFMQLRDREWPKWLVTLGEYSFGIFFIHGVIMRGTAAGLAKIPGLADMQPLFQPVLVSISVGLSCAVITVTRRLAGRELSSRLFGF